MEKFWSGQALQVCLCNNDVSWSGVDKVSGETMTSLNICQIPRPVVDYDQEDQEQYQGRMGTRTDQKYPTPGTT